MPIGTLPPEEEARFWANVRKTPTCWIWEGANDTYGRFYIPSTGKTLGAHRIAYELVRGEIPDGLQIDHLCRVPLCVNSAHLEAVTLRENVLRGIGPPAINARKTHCVRGHELTGDNVYTTSKGRSCRTCKNEATKRWQDGEARKIADGLQAEVAKLPSGRFYASDVAAALGISLPAAQGFVARARNAGLLTYTADVHPPYWEKAALSVGEES